MANSAVVGMLRAILQLDTAEFEAGGKRAVTAAKGVGDSLSTSLGPGAKSAGGFVDNLNNSLGKVGLSLQSLSVAGATAMLVGLGREAMSAASNFMDLRDRTGLTLQELQRLEVAGAQVGVSLDQAARGVGMLQRNLVGGDKGAVDALKKLNLNVAELLEMTPGAMFEEISRAIAKVPDPTQRAALAFEILGRSGQQLLPLLLSNVEALTAGVDTMSDETIENLDRLDDAWRRMKINMRNSVGEMLGALTDAKIGFGSFNQQVMESAGFFGPIFGAIQRTRRDAEGLTAAFGDQGLAGAMKRLGETAAKSGGALGDVFDRMKRDLPKMDDVLADFNITNKQNEERNKERIAEYEAYLKRVQDLAKQFSGGKLTQDVKELNEAIRQIGGVSKASAYELSKFGKLGEMAYGFMRQGGKLEPDIAKLALAWRLNNSELPKVEQSLGNIVVIGKDVTDVVKRSFEAWKVANIEASKWLGKITETGSIDFTKVGKDATAMIENVDKAFKFFALRSRVEAQERLRDAQKYYQILVDTGLASEKELSDARKKIRDAERDAARAAAGDVTGFADDLRKAITDLPQTILGAVMGGGNVGGAIGGLFGGALTTELGKTIGEKLSGVLGKTVGGAIGSIIPGLGTLLGAGIGGFVGKLFGPTEGMKTNDLRDAWMAQMGGLQKIQKLIGDFNNDPVLMSTFQRLYSTGTQKQFQAAAEAFEKRMRELLGEREDAQARLNAALQKYGFTIDELGPKWKAQQLTDQAKELVLDYTALVASGIDVGTVIERMGTAFNEYVQLAKKAGVEIPLEMKPMIEKMIEMGLLTDENGVAFTSLEDAGITFAETLSAGFDRVIAKLDQLIRAITDDLGKAIDDIPPVEVEVAPRWGRLPRFTAPEEEPVVFDSPLKRITGSGLAWLNPGDVAGMPELTPEFSGAFGGGMMTIIQTLDGREVTRAVVPYLPGEVRRLGLTKV